MRKLLLSAAALSFLAAPAFAQGGKAEFGRQSADQAQREQAVREHFQQNLGRPNPAPAPQQQQRQPDPRRDGNRGNDTRRDDNRGGGNWNNSNRNDYRGGNDRRDYDRRDHDRGRNDYRGPRRDYSSFQYYHRSWNAPRRYRVDPYRRPSGWYYRRWNYGDFLPAAFWAASYWLSNYNAYALPAPPYGTVWVRYGDDALLIDRETGEVISVQYGVFY